MPGRRGGGGQDKLLHRVVITLVIYPSLVQEVFHIYAITPRKKLKLEREGRKKANIYAMKAIVNRTPHMKTTYELYIFSTVILSLPLIQEGQLSVSSERMCAILVNRIED